MRGVVVTRPGGPEVLELRELQSPRIEDDEVLIRVTATAVNKSDLISRQVEQSSPGSNLILGLECSGYVVAVGHSVTKWKIGDQVCALLNGEGYAEEVAVPAEHILRAPSKVSLENAAALPMAVCSAWFSLFGYAKLTSEHTLLVHASEIGMFAVQIAKLVGARVFVAAETEEKLAFYKSLDADLCFNCTAEDIFDKVREETQGRGVDIILDSGAANFLQYSKCLSSGGTLMVFDPHDNPVVEYHPRKLCEKNGQIKVFDIQALTFREMVLTVKRVESMVWPAIEEGSIKLLDYRFLSLSNAAKAHRLMETNKTIEKILLTTSDEQDHETSPLGKLMQNLSFNLCPQM